MHIFNSFDEQMVDDPMRAVETSKLACQIRADQQAKRKLSN